MRIKSNLFNQNFQLSELFLMRVFFAQVRADYSIQSSQRRACEEGEGGKKGEGVHKCCGLSLYGNPFWSKLTLEMFKL